MRAKLPPLIPVVSLELGSCTTLPPLKQAHALLITGGFSGDDNTLARIIRSAALSLPGDIGYASLIFHRLEHSDSYLWNAMLQGYSLRFQYDAAVAEFAQMLRSGATPDEHTYPVLLKSLSKSGASNPAQIHAQLLKFGLGGDFFVQNSLLSSYTKGGNLDTARKIFYEMPRRDAISWNSMVLGHVNNHRPEQGLSFFVKMKSLKVEIDAAIIVSALNGCAMVGNIWLAMSIQAFYVESGRVNKDVFVGSALIDVYAKCGFCIDARKAFEEMPFRNVVSWTSLISGFVHCSRFVAALSVFSSMLDYGPNPNQVTLTSVLAACAHLGALEMGRRVHSYMNRVGMDMNSYIGTALIDMYSKCGRIHDAFSVFHTQSNKDVYCWSAIINGSALHGLGLKSINLFSEMLQQGVQPNGITFLGVLGACSHGGLVQEGKEYFDRMQKVYGIRPEIEHYGSMVDLLCRAGDLKEALYFIESMPMEPSVGIWGALFSACMSRGDFVLGERVGKHMIEIRPEISVGYMLLTNVYSGSKRWKEAAKMRIEMRGKKVEKVPGSSWVELSGVLHEFLASDGSQAQGENLHEIIDGLTKLMKLQGIYSCNDQKIFGIEHGTSNWL